ncbi:oligosaccharide flippase family protein [Halorubrum vacuolatum]|uniref:Membrane protein involved in the export of O-antigen and teichoic acid n=1 Tax=Halorubrum vacuolatum TaxID=63740 RepID=A0A238UMV4_HALVU|nr:oligosaccharide flippase family protein [Halorubrum vacuolatum]SNR23368.1 Membrane protein involved in the export of O-antigen and teichoic acid [Halorubrum vacuolatum]
MGGDDSPARRSSLATILRGGSLYTVGKVAFDIGEFLLHLLVSRWLGAGPYGLFAYGKTLAFTALLVTNFGSDKSILRYLPQYAGDPPRRRFLLALAWLTSILGASIVAGGLFVAAPTVNALTLEESAFVGVLRLFAVILFLDTIANLLYATFRALELIEYEVLSKRLFKPLMRVTCVGLALLGGVSVFGVVAAMVVASVLTLGLAGYLFSTRTEIRPQLRSPAATRETVRGYYNYSLPLSAKEAGTLLQGRLDVLLVGVFLSATAVGIYNIAVLLAGVLYIPLLAANQLFAPVASRLYSREHRADLEAVYSAVTRWIFTISLLLTLFIATFRTELLGLFGSQFTAGTTVLLLLLFGQLCNAATGPSGYLLMMTDHQYVVMANEWVFGIANAVLTVIFIQLYGLVGAAMASAGVLAVRNLTKLLEVRYLERMTPYSRAYYKPVSAGALTALALYSTQWITPSDWVGVVIGGLTAIVIYAGTLRALGLEAIDAELYADLLDRSP